MDVGAKLLGTRWAARAPIALFKAHLGFPFTGRMPPLTTTWAATEYVARNWRSRHQAFGDRPFALCLGFGGLRLPTDHAADC